MTTAHAADGLRRLGPSEAITVDYVVAYYLEDLRQRVSVVRVDHRLYAFADLCTCVDGPGCPLSGGLLTGTTIMCQCHGTRFDVGTGSVVDGTAKGPLQTYQVREIDGTIQIRA